MNTCLIPQGYRPPLCGYDMQRAIEFVKSSFQENLKFALNLRRVSAPLFVDRNSGLNDNLNGVERPVGFDIPAIGGADGEVVHSLAKWKRLALKRYGFYPGNGLYTDMNAIRRDESLDNIHSVYVDQWDWEWTTSPSAPPMAGMSKPTGCWKVLPSVGKDGEHPALCARCAAVVRKLDVTP